MNKINHNSIKQSKRPEFEIDLNERVIYFTLSGNILLVALKRKIILFVIDFETFSYKKFQEIEDSQVRIIKPCAEILARNFMFAAAHTNFISIYHVYEDDTSSCIARLENNGYINSVDFCEDFLASGSDDQNCKIYSVKDEFSLEICLNFSAAVTGVKFNAEEVNKLLISVKNGSIFIYCLKVRQSLYSFYSAAPLMNVDWSIKNPCYVAAIVADQVFYFDISKPE
jgi:WD40 repeat protein